jgi:hypothetical protein
VLFAPSLSLAVWAQEPALDEVPPPEPATLLPAAAPASLSEGWLWVEAGPRTVLDLVDVALHPDDDRVWAVVAGDGGVFVTTDGGRRWFEVKGPDTSSGAGRSSSDEEALTEIEARLGELASAVDTPDESLLEDGEIDEDELAEELERAAEEAQTEAQQVIDEVQSELEAQPWFLPEGSAGAQPLLPRVLFTRSGLLVLTRADGLHLSEDLGASWHLVLEEPATSFVELQEAGFVVGTPTGARWSATLLEWSPVPALDGLSVHFLYEAEGAWAATSKGLWWSWDGRTWERQPSWFDELWAIGRVDDGLLLGARDTIWRALAPTQLPAVPSEGAPVPAVRAFARRDDGLLLAASAQGPFESIDGGRTWSPLLAGLDAKASRDLEARGELVLLCAADGLKRLVPRVDGPQGEQLPDWVPLGALVDASTRRRELTARPGSRWARALLPELTFEYTHNQVVGDDWHADTWTIREVDTWWSGKIRLTWRPGTSTSSDSFDADLADDLQLLVFEDEVVLDDGSLTALIGSKVSRGSVAYRSELADIISRLYLTRQRLVLEQRWLADEPLYEQTLRALQLAEVEARLDALTDGAVSRWDNDPSGGDP